jgi:hypothetical protein
MAILVWTILACIQNVLVLCLCTQAGVPCDVIQKDTRQYDIVDPLKPFAIFYKQQISHSGYDDGCWSYYPVFLQVRADDTQFVHDRSFPCETRLDLSDVSDTFRL